MIPVVTTPARSRASGLITHELHRAWLPLEIYPISAGVKGGLAGSVAMAVLAMIYGRCEPQHLVSHQPSGGRLLSCAETTEQISAFHFELS